MTVSRTCAYGKRPVHSTLAQVENRTVKIDDEPMHLLESVPSRKHYPGSWR